ncbi:2-polyprenyl-6-methoxyphenol hydroxylase-like FAD-dependent oxidoreductase [Castellaniella defragrans]|uniref:2-polyprenyl-6-methoxyphenol hydroxylase-like FAD-dependent oxidoreductase n=2 Tax=Castellaniella defragrans TaxID=75697 RepID=A0A7W9TP34_CASDE|nr:FAD-dependent oxidoreductase [Castellaniella defragrans]MBB6084204.1 2-polyprenyl-6-methoxyphenol hydroxylase-like FAD-dependent oxidoreductase [Castellaniella defragrans]
MAAVNTALVVGGGFSGMAAAIRMRRAGIAVDLVEIDSEWCPLGAGITINGATLRALETLGVYERFKEYGVTSDGVDVYTAEGASIGRLPTPPVVGSDVPGGGGIMRPDLARILADATRQAGVSVRLGTTFKEVVQDAEGVDVDFTDGTRGRYDLLVGADGVHSRLRELFFPEVAPPEYIGQGVWRAVLPRLPDLARPRMWLGRKVKIGVNPVSPTRMYMFLTEERPVKTHIDEATWADVVAGLMRPFTAPDVQSLIQYVHAPEAAIDYRPLGNLLVPLPWNRGRVVMIGDTVAATTPHLASGAGIGIESGIVLGEELGRHADLQAALDAFHARRWERCRMVIHNSERLCRIEMEGGDKEEHGRILRESMQALTASI